MNAGLYGWILIRQPSKPKSFGKGYCGAGTEDYFYLVKIENKSIKYIDKTPAQSCLSSISIEGLDEGEIELNQLLKKNNELSYSITKTVAEKTFRTSVKITPKSITHMTRQLTDKHLVIFSVFLFFRNHLYPQNATLMTENTIVNHIKMQTKDLIQNTKI